MNPDDELVIGPDGLARCPWVGWHEDYIAYHDHEWGRPVADDQRLFEKLCLEGFQSGLSWLTILRKRPAFRAAFAEFSPSAMAQFGPRDVDRLLSDAGIVRHRGKILAAINNATRVMELTATGTTLAALLWSFEPEPSERPSTFDWSTLRSLSTSPASVRMARDLKARGWRYVGPTTAYAFMQSMGMVNDHVEGCHVRPEVEQERSRFVRPS